MNMNTLDKIFEPQTLADDLIEVRHIYAQFFTGITETDWDKPVKGGPKEWTLHETVAHLVSLNGAGLESIRHTLRGEPYNFKGLDNRYEFNAFNRKGIDEHLDTSMRDLCTKLLDILDQAANIARDLQPGQSELSMRMAIYNRPVTVVEALSIIIFHAGLAHAAQVAEPAGLPPLWVQLSPAFRHRVIGRVMRAFSLLYRFDVGGSLRDTILFRVDGPDGGEWHVELSPEAATSGEGSVEHPGLAIHLREPAVFFKMLTSRLNLPMALISGAMKLHGNLRLFLRMDSLFSVDARPKPETNETVFKQWFYHGKQWLYRGQRPNWIAKILNRGWAIVASRSASSNGLVALEVLGRKSGRAISFPLVMVTMDGGRYLASMLGDNTQWVRNVRAWGGRAILRNGGREEVQLEELPVEQRAPILKAYLQAAPGARPHVPVDKDAPLAEFEKIAAAHPVFRLTSTPS